MITGKTLIDWGFEPGSWFKAAIGEANEALRAGMDESDLVELVRGFVPAPRISLNKTDPAPFKTHLIPQTQPEWDNLANVERDMRLLMQVPTVIRGSIMPDACPAGVIPVGGVVETENAIHPGYHSADICCSMMVSYFSDQVDPKEVLELGHKVTHFGGGGRRNTWRVPTDVMETAHENPFLKGLEGDMAAHFGTQGDGNHFLFVGRSEQTGQTVVVTHHGSRRPGAQLYKRGMAVAKRMTNEIAEGIDDRHAWIPYDTREGQDYWQALQIIREWTKRSHAAIHREIEHRTDGRVTDWLWNEHNFVFQRQPGRFLHAKGATPAWGGHAADADGYGRVAIPLNMAEPVLIAVGSDADSALGFAPHGAGRNISRTQHLREAGEEFPVEELAELRQRLDIRFWHGTPDPSELPSAYKNATAVTRQIQHFGLASIVDRIMPYGCIMAGNWNRENV